MILGKIRIAWHSRGIAFALFLGLATFLFPPALLSAEAHSALQVNAAPQANAGQQANSALPAQAYSLPQDKLAKAVTLGKIRPSIYFGAEFLQLAFLWLLLASGSASRLAGRIEIRTKRPWLRAAIFSAVLVLALCLAVDLPIGAIGHAVSLHYGISVEGWPAWLLDQAKIAGLTLLLEVPALMLAFGLMRWMWSRRRAWLWFAVASVPAMVLGTFLLPSLIEPLFYTYEPLAKSHPALVAQLERVVARTGVNIPPDRMFLMKASDKTNGINAYVTGLGASKRIVIWDTTADRVPMDEILAIFAHESGHYVLHHIPQGLAFGCAGMFAFFWATERLAEFFVRRRGTQWQVAAVNSLTGLAVVVLAVSFVQILAEPIENAFSRHIEHEADVYGQEAVHGLVADPQKTGAAAFNRLGEVYLDDPNPNPLVVFWTYDHPSIQSRATFAAHYDPWAPGQIPRFFPK